jgi:hypothetical protein
VTALLVESFAPRSDGTSTGIGGVDCSLLLFRALFVGHLLVDGFFIILEVDCDWIVSGDSSKVTHGVVKASSVECHPVHELTNSRVVNDLVAS